MSSPEPIAEQDPPAATAPARCRNCGAPLLGRFCASCGQDSGVHMPTTMEFVHELTEGLTHSDSRLWRTLLCLWTRPGRLTQEFVAGRRAAYLPPFRLFLVLSVTFFLVASLVPSGGVPIRLDDTGASTAATASGCDSIKFEGSSRLLDLNQRARHVCKEVVRDNGANLKRIALETMSKAMLIFLPLIAFLNSLLYWHPRYRYPEHLLFFAHLHAFYFSAALLALAATLAAHIWPALQGSAESVETLLGWAAFIYTIVAVRRVFAKSWAGAVFKTFALSVAYMIVFSLTLAGVYAYAMLQL